MRWPGDNAFLARIYLLINRYMLVLARSTPGLRSQRRHRMAQRIIAFLSSYHQACSALARATIATTLFSEYKASNFPESKSTTNILPQKNLNIQAIFLLHDSAFSWVSRLVADILDLHQITACTQKASNQPGYATTTTTTELFTGETTTLIGQALRKLTSAWRHEGSYFSASTMPPRDYVIFTHFFKVPPQISLATQIRH